MQCFCLPITDRDTQKTSKMQHSKRPSGKGSSGQTTSSVSNRSGLSPTSSGVRGATKWISFPDTCAFSFACCFVKAHRGNLHLEKRVIRFRWLLEKSRNSSEMMPILRLKKNFNKPGNNLNISKHPYIHEILEVYYEPEPNISKFLCLQSHSFSLQEAGTCPTSSGKRRGSCGIPHSPAKTRKMLSGFSKVVYWNHVICLWLPMFFWWCLMMFDDFRWCLMIGWIYIKKRQQHALTCFSFMSVAKKIPSYLKNIKLERFAGFYWSQHSRALWPRACDIWVATWRCWQLK